MSAITNIVKFLNANDTQTHELMKIGVKGVPIQTILTSEESSLALSSSDFYYGSTLFLAAPGALTSPYVQEISSNLVKVVGSTLAFERFLFINSMMFHPEERIAHRALGSSIIYDEARYGISQFNAFLERYVLAEGPIDLNLVTLMSEGKKFRLPYF